MEPFYKVILKEIYAFLTDRVFILFFIFALFFIVLGIQLFSLQIVHTEEYQRKAKPTSYKTQSIEAPRGQIYDRMGRPLAINETTFSLNIDPSIRYSNVEDEELTAFTIYKKMIEVLDEREEELLIDFPMIISEKNIEEIEKVRNLPNPQKPRSDKDKEKITKEDINHLDIVFDLDNNDTKEKRFKEDMGAEGNATAEETFLHLLETFHVPKEGLEDIEMLSRVLGVSCAVYEERFRLEPVEVALDISDETVASIEERNNEFPGVYADVVYQRKYPGGEEFSHILGYIRKINEEELENNKEHGYTEEDLFGKAGLEQALELDLKGEKGERIIEVDRTGRRVGTVSEKAPVSGDKIFLTLDAEFQKEVVGVLEDILTEILTARLKGWAGSGNVSYRKLFTSMIEGNTIDANFFMKAEEGSTARKIGDLVLSEAGEDKEEKEYQEVLLNLFEQGKVGMSELLVALSDIGRLDMTEEEVNGLLSGQISASTMIMRKIESGDFTPQMANIDPATGSIVVVDVNDGGVLAAANYPNYDNNELVNTFNNDYYTMLNKDPTKPMINRSFSEKRAPGSTFKMITAFAGLDSGTVGVNEGIRDYGTFTKAGKPYAHCDTRAAGYHGTVDVRKALEVSCNYYFYETSYRMGNSKSGNKLAGINTLNDYMKKFGLGLPTGIEITEASPTISGPEFKEESILLNPKATESDARWSDGDTIRTAIGQSLNDYTAATMAKYIATIANGGKRYSLHFLHEQVNGETEERHLIEPVLEEDIGMTEEIKTAIHEGMRRVTEGDRGTARGVYSGFPMTVAGKTGTAQQSGVNHATFGAFVPYEEPEIAIFVILPFSENDYIRSPAAEVTKRVVSAYYGLEDENSETEDKNLENSENNENLEGSMDEKPVRGELVP